MAHCHTRGLEVLLGDESHIYNYEAGGAAAVGGLVFHVLPNQPNGQISLTALDKAYRNRPNDPHCPRPGVLCLENTHNRCGGAVLPLEYMHEVAAWAAARSLPVHLDGARVFNAAVALGVPVSKIAQHVTSVSFCLSKVGSIGGGAYATGQCSSRDAHHNTSLHPPLVLQGLACPVGSILVGPRAFIQRAHRLRKMLGGGLRQVGVLAAPGLVALRTMVERLQEDHDNAMSFAKHISLHAPGIVIDLDTVQSNVVVFHLPKEPFSTDQHLHNGAASNGCYAAPQPAADEDNVLTSAVVSQGDLTQPPRTPSELVARLRARGVLVSCFREGVRAVTHANVSKEQVQQAALAVCDVMRCAT